MTEEMKKFEMGKKYIIDSVEFAGNVTVEVISRTLKFATFKKYGQERRLKLHDWGDREVAFWGDTTIDALDVERA